METKDIFYSKIKSDYIRIYRAYKDFQKSPTIAKAESRNDYKNMMEILKKKWGKFEGYYQKLENSTDDSWENLVQPIEDSFNKLNQFFKIFLKRFS